MISSTTTVVVHAVGRHPGRHRRRARGGQHRLVAVACTCLLANASSCGTVLSLPPVWPGSYFHGRVVDAETGKPIEAVVVAQWTRNMLIQFNGGGATQRLAEDLTDENGSFRVANAPGINLNPLEVTGTPNLYVYAPGYWTFPGFYSKDPNYRHLQNLDRDGTYREMLNGLEVKLRRMPSPTEMRSNEAVAPLSSSQEGCLPHYWRLKQQHRAMAGLSPERKLECSLW